MSDAVVDDLIIDLLTWLAQGDRNYDEVMDAWRTSCPKLTVWEDAGYRGLIAKEDVQARAMVRITPAGRDLLRRHEVDRPAKDGQNA